MYCSTACYIGNTSTYEIHQYSTCSSGSPDSGSSRFVGVIGLVGVVGVVGVVVVEANIVVGGVLSVGDKRKGGCT